MTGTATVTIERRLAAAPETVFDAWLDSDGAGSWLFATPGGTMEAVEIDARVGGRFRIAERRQGELAEHFGEYLEIDRPRRLAFDFWTSFSAERSRIVIDIEPDGDGAWLSLSHSGVWTDYVEKTQQGWTMIVNSLERALT